MRTAAVSLALEEAGRAAPRTWKMVCVRKPAGAECVWVPLMQRFLYLKRPLVLGSASRSSITRAVTTCEPMPMSTDTWMRAQVGVSERAPLSGAAHLRTSREPAMNSGGHCFGTECGRPPGGHEREAVQAVRVGESSARRVGVYDECSRAQPEVQSRAHLVHLRVTPAGTRMGPRARTHGQIGGGSWCELLYYSI